MTDPLDLADPRIQQFVAWLRSLAVADAEAFRDGDPIECDLPFEQCSTLAKPIADQVARELRTREVLRARITVPAGVDFDTEVWPAVRELFYHRTSLGMSSDLPELLAAALEIAEAARDNDERNP